MNDSHNRMIITFSFLLAMLLSVYPLSGLWQWLRPQFVTLLVIYWALSLPQSMNVLMLWLLGCWVDLLSGGVLGQHALSLMLVVYVCLLSYQRVRSYSTGQQVIYVFFLVLLQQLINNWVHSLVGRETSSLLLALPALVSALAWPFVVLLMSSIVARYRVS